jgi:copper(I)-binding protein
MPTLGGSRVRRAAVAVTVAAPLLLSACASVANRPDTATNASTVPGPVPHLGQATQGGISITGVTVQRTGSRLDVTARIANAGAAADDLTTVGSQVSPTLTLRPAVKVPARGSVQLGPGGTSVVLQQEGRLEPGGTVALTLQFQQAGSVKVFSSFQ